MLPERWNDNGSRAEQPDACVVALRALAWLCADEQRADRLLALTGLDAPALRAGAGERRMQAAVLAFLAAHEPDLIACADALDLPPATLAAAARALEGEA